MFQVINDLKTDLRVTQARAEWMEMETLLGLKT